MDTERERKEERERAEQRMGVLTYLAQSTLGKDSERQSKACMTAICVGTSGNSRGTSVIYLPTLFVCVERASEPWYTSKQGETEAASERQKLKKHSMDPLQVMQEARKRMRSHTQPAAMSSLSHITDIPHQSAREHAAEGTSHAEQGMAEEPRTKRHKGSKEVSTAPPRIRSSAWPLQHCGVPPPCADSMSSSFPQKHSKHRKHRKRKSSPVMAVVPLGGPSTEEMRQERLKREKEEQRRTEALLRRAALAET